MTDDVNDQVEWLQAIPEEIRNAPYFKPLEDGSFRTVEQVAADLNNVAQLQGNLGESHVRIPSNDASDEDKLKFTERVLKLDPSLTRKSKEFSAVPETADGYETPADDGDFTALQEAAKAMNLTQAQFDKFASAHLQNTKTGKEQQGEWKTKQDQLLTEKLGQAKEDHMARTIRAIKATNPDLAESIKEGKVDSGIVLALDGLVHQMLEMGGDGKTFNQQAGASQGFLTPDEARSRADEIRGDLISGKIKPREMVKMQNKMVEYERIAMAT